MLGGKKKNQQKNREWWRNVILERISRELSKEVSFKQRSKGIKEQIIQVSERRMSQVEETPRTKALWLGHAWRIGEQLREQWVECGE